MKNVLQYSDDLVAGAARGLTRRRLFRNSSGAALSAALSVSYLGAGAEVAEACTWSTVCGPSPICGDPRCNGSHCDTSRSDTQWRKHDQFVCGTSSDVNCWQTCSSAGNLWQCCDCAGNDTNGCGELCSGCGAGTWRACICHAIVASC